MRSPKGARDAKSGDFSIPFTNLKNEILREGYELSLVFIDNLYSRKLNRQYRGKDKSTNVLSFPLSKNSGEIFIDLITAKKECAKFKMTYEKFVSLLFIHGLLHLKGMRHGAKMERAEYKFLNGTSNSSGYRYRHVRD